MKNKKKITKSVDENKNIKYFYDMTHKAKNVFGNIVKSAQQNIQCVYDWEKKQTQEIDDFNKSRINNIENDEGLIFDEGEIIIEFTNGKKVRMYTSEWGGAYLI